MEWIFVDVIGLRINQAQAVVSTSKLTLQPDPGIDFDV
jgi:hypothetical protein